MKVYLKPASGSATDNLERAKVEMERVIGFRGKVTSAKVEGKQIAVTIEINPKWDLPEAEKVKSLKEWIPAKVRTVFKVLSVSA
jgi:hypothetical protein